MYQDRRSSGQGTIKSLPRKPIQQKRPTSSSQAEAIVQRTEGHVRELLHQLGNPLRLSPNSLVIDTFLDWIPGEHQAWLEANRSLNGRIEVLNGDVRDAKHDAKAEAENARQAESARNYWKGQFYDTTKEAERLELRLDEEKNKVARGLQELSKSRGEVKHLGHSLDQVTTENERLRRDLEKETRLFEEESREVQRLENQLQEEQHTYETALALLKDELDREKSSRREERQVHSERLASQRSEFQQQREQEEKKHKQIERKQRQVIASHEVENYRPIGDDVFQISFQTIALTIGNLLVLVPQPSNPGSGAAAEIDSTGFLARSMSVRSNGDGRPRGGGAKAWPRFFRSVCWKILIAGFFQDQPGFGVFGSEGEGYELLKGLREVFMQTTAGGKTISQYHEWFAQLLTLWHVRRTEWGAARPQ